MSENWTSSGAGPEAGLDVSFRAINFGPLAAAQGGSFSARGVMHSR